MAKNEVKYGAVLSYILIIVNAVYGLIISPFMLSTIGASEYGVYKTIGSLSASLSVLELGIGGTMQRYIAKFRALKDNKSSSNFSAMGLIQAAVLGCAVLAVGVILYFSIDRVYGDTFSRLELIRSHQIFVIQIIYIVCHIFENVLFGVISGYNRFIFINSLKIIVLAFKVVLYFVILPIFKNSLIIVLISLITEIITISVYIIYIKFILHHKFNLYFWDNALFKESFLYTILLFAQSLIIQFNGNIDNIVIGAVLGASAVTVYSFAIQIFNMYETCATSVSSVILPTIAEQIYSGATPKQLSDTVKKFGRVQWIFLGGALFAFICFGNEFFHLWLGEEFNDCYKLSLILMIPVTFPLVVNVCLAILKVKNLLTFRTISMAYSVVFNALLTIIGTHFWGYWAAAVGTAVSTIVGSIISMNIYYQKKLDINIFKLYISISGRITPCLLLACLVGFILNRFIYGFWIGFICKAVIFILVYGLLLIIFGLNESEKESLIGKRRIKS